MNMELLRRLSNSFGPPGAEAEPRMILREELEEYADEIVVPDTRETVSSAVRLIITLYRAMFNFSD